jgi:hypothetical protein
LSRSCVNMATYVYQTFSGIQVTDTMLVEAAKLFNEHYGIWGNYSEKPGNDIPLLHLACCH